MNYKSSLWGTKKLNKSVKCGKIREQGNKGKILKGTRELGTEPPWEPSLLSHLRASRRRDRRQDKNRMLHYVTC